MAKSASIGTIVRRSPPGVVWKTAYVPIGMPTSRLNASATPPSERDTLTLGGEIGDWSLRIAVRHPQVAVDQSLEISPVLLVPGQIKTVKVTEILVHNGVALIPHERRMDLGAETDDERDKVTLTTMSGRLMRRRRMIATMSG